MQMEEDMGSAHSCAAGSIAIKERRKCMDETIDAICAGGIALPECADGRWKNIFTEV